MAKLHFRYSAMNAGKSTALIQTAYNYSERDQRALLIKPSIDTKGGRKIVSRIGASYDVDELFYITKLYDIPVIAFGLRTDFKTNGFEGSTRLLELADCLEEMPTICRCGKKARFNGRKLDGDFVTTGESIVIDDGKKVEYESLCGKCYVSKVLKLKK
ncbi:MAG: thymidine kinase [Bacilli bacterium]|nr:thymidine kinase [Bacilli bacterium]